MSEVRKAKEGDNKGSMRLYVMSPPISVWPKYEEAYKRHAKDNCSRVDIGAVLCSFAKEQAVLYRESMSTAKEQFCKA